MANPADIVLIVIVAWILVGSAVHHIRKWKAGRGGSCACRCGGCGGGACEAGKD